MKNRRNRGRRNETRLRRIRIQYMRRRHRKSVRARRLALLCCIVLTAGGLLILAEQGGQLLEIENTQKTEGQKAEVQMPQETRIENRQFGIIFRPKDGEITIYRESSN